MWLGDLGRSFRYAGRGILRSVREERNLRIHLCAVCYVSAAGWLAELSGTQWAALALCFGAVIRAELINTAVENLCDALHPGAHPKVGAAKDAAAGSVLVLALAAVGVAAALFGPWLKAGGLGEAFRLRPWLGPVLLASLIPAVLFILFPTGNTKEKEEQY